MPRGRPAAVQVAPEPEMAAVVAELPVAPLTPERQKLADAIAAVAELEADSVTTSAAVSQAELDRLAAFHRLDEAERTLERSKPKPESTFSPPHRPAGAYWGTQEAYDAHLTLEAEAVIPPIPIGEARAALATATDDYDSAKRAEQFHQNRLKQLQNSLQSKRYRIGDAVRAVLRSDPALLALANEARSLGTRARAAVYAFSNAVGGDIIQHGSPYYGYNQPASSFREDPEGWALANAWAVALEGLKTDPTTPLPMPETGA